LCGWEVARRIRPCQRLYHRGRLGDAFRILTPWEYVRHTPIELEPRIAQEAPTP
jgi:hypothetical protein